MSRRILTALSARSRLILFVGRGEQAQEVVRLFEEWGQDDGPPPQVELVLWFAPLVAPVGTPTPNGFAFDLARYPAR